MKNAKHQHVLFSSHAPAHRMLFYGLGVANLLCIVYFVMLGYYNRLAMDDYCYLTAQNEHGFFSPFTFWYQHYQGRFSPQFLINIVNIFSDLGHTLLPFTIVFLILFIWVIYRLLKKIISVLSSFELLHLSVFVLSLFVINNYEFNTFFWLNASAMYFGGVLFLLIGINEIVSSKRNLQSYLLVAFCAVYVGSSSETFALIWSMVAGLAFIFFFRKLTFSYARFMADIHLKKLLVAFLFCFVSFLIMYLAPGNDVRLKITAINLHQQIPLPVHELIPAAINAFVMFGSITLLKFPLWVVLSLPFFYLGIYLKDKIRFAAIGLPRLLPLSLYFVVFLWICLIPTVYVQGNMGPKRALTHVAFYMTCYVVVFSFVSGLKSSVNRYRFLWVAMTSMVCWFFVIMGRMIHEVPEVKRYAHSEDVRMAYLKTFENKIPGDTLALTPLYLPVASDASEHVKQFAQNALKRLDLDNSVLSKSIGQSYTHYILMPDEIRPAPQDFVNDCICNALHLEFHVKVKK